MTTTTDLSLIPSRILNDITSCMSERNDTTPLAILSSREMFEIWIEYNGIIGYTESIIEALDSIRKSKGE